MSVFTVEIEGIKEFGQALEQLRSEKIPTVLRNAINDTAFGLKAHLSALIKSTFPTAHPSTVKNIFVKKADKANLYATIFFDQLYRRGVDEYMAPLVRGGPRGFKPAETKLGRYYIPSNVDGGTRITNQYGNIRGGLVQQVLSRLGKSELYAGSNSNETENSRARRTKRLRPIEYFMITKAGKGLQPGIYQRMTQQGQGLSNSVRKSLPSGAFQRGKGGIVKARAVKPIMIFPKKSPTYKPMFPFFTSGKEYILKNLPVNLKKETDFYISRGFGR